MLGDTRYFKSTSKPIIESENIKHHDQEVSVRSAPFVFIFSTTALGIAIGYSQVSFKLWTIFTIGILITAVFLEKSKPKGNVKYLLYFLFLFLQLGFFSMKTQQKIPNEFITKEIYQLECEIVELEKGDKKWNKGIAEIQQIFPQDQNSIIVKHKLLIYTDKKTSTKLGPGDIILLESQIQKIQNKGNPGEFDAFYYWRSKGVNYMSFFTESDYTQIKDVKIKMKNAIKNGIIKSFKKNIPYEYLGIVKALFLGDKSSLEQEMRHSFSAAGAMHLLAISGLHIGLFIWIIYGFFRFFSRFIRRNTALLFAFVFIWLYAYLIDFPPSVLRSVLMFSILSFGYFTRGIKNQLNILLFSATILLLLNPAYLFDIGYQLSYAAMLGIILCYSPLSSTVRFKKKPLTFFWNATALCASAQLFTFPICLYYFHQFPNYFILSNLGIVVAAGIIVGIGGAMIIFSQFGFIAEKMAFLLSISLTLLITFIKWIEHLPGSIAQGFIFHEIELFILLICCAGVYWSLFNKKQRLTSGIFGICICVIIAVNHNRQLSSKHLVLFNTKRFSCALHMRNTTYFLHDNLLPKNYQQLLSNYNKCYPGEIQVLNLRNQIITITSPFHKLNFSWKEKNLIMRLDGKSYNICYSQKDILKFENKKIGLAWIEGATIRLNKAYFFHF